ncbi:Phosphoinositide phospholipase C 6 [Acorus calamus]|uniref:Phosphoinositide phospholipase C 6 n=1 Tax=Acorus calamus TaxID=4465 RepID=A0AAV9C5K1_ACOCL|nr:Phosphoinositide phospholipase C 6 [Acorus calamus]
MVKIYIGDGWNLDFHQTDFDMYSPPDFYTTKTKIIEDNWIPVWNEEFTFPLTVLEFAFLRIETIHGVGGVKAKEAKGAGNMELTRHALEKRKQSTNNWCFLQPNNVTFGDEVVEAVPPDNKSIAADLDLPCAILLKNLR